MDELVVSAFPDEPPYKFGRQMLGVGRAAAITKEEELAARPQARDNRICCFKNRGAAITRKHCPKLGAFAQGGVN